MVFGVVVRSADLAKESIDRIGRYLVDGDTTLLKQISLANSLQYSSDVPLAGRWQESADSGCPVSE